MDKVRFLKDYAVAWDGINATYYKQGDECEIDASKLEKLVDAGVVELSVKKIKEPSVKKVVEPTETKSKDKKPVKNKSSK